MSKQTAIDWFSEQTFNQIELLKSGYVNKQEFLNGMLKLRDQAKAMEKEQIIDAYAQGFIEAEQMDKGAEQYYNETFNKD